jgi:hypothetical protein
MSHARILVFFAVVLSALGAMRVGLPNNPRKSLAITDERDLRKKIAEARSSHVLGNCLNEFLSNADSKKLAKDAEDADLTIAMRASWLVAEQASLSPDDKAKSFLKRFKSRVGLEVPKVWEEELRNLVRRRNGFSNLKGGFGFGDESAGTVKSVGDGLEVVGGNAGEAIRINKLSLEELSARFQLYSKRIKVAIAKGKDKAFVVLYSDITDEYPLWCVDPKTGMRIWEQSIWGVGIVGPHSGFGENNVVVTSDDKHVAVFGRGCGTHLYIEVFSIENGKPILRFATNNWCTSNAG